MMDQSQDILKYLEIAKRRKYWVIIPFLAVLLGGLAYYLRAPKIYEAETLILVQPQRVPEEYVRPIVDTSVEDRLRTISQQVTSRTNLENIIKEHDLRREYPGALGIDRLVSTVRDSIRIDVKGGGRGRETSTFTIAFQGKDPHTVMRVTNALASNFISENLKIREEQALGTSVFLTDELESIRKRLLEKEQELKDYREHYMGGLPEQLQTNLSILERLEGQIEQLNNSLRDAENRKILLQTQITERAKAASEVTLPPTAEAKGARDLQALRNELASLEARYTSRHPDVIRLKETIANLERKMSEAGGDVEGGQPRSLTELHGTLKVQLQEIELEIRNTKEEIRKTKAQVAWYQKKVEETPKREQELLSLNRDYENLKELYNSLLNRKLEADIAVSMEKKQKGEQFRVIDPAKVPTAPVKPDMRKIFLMTIALGLGLGGGLAYLVEMMDTSYRDPDEVEKELKVPVLVSIPIRHTEHEIKAQRIKETLKAASVAAGFVVCAVAVVIGTKGVGKTIEYLKTVLEKM
jgi:polysaccharide chain length determinant protein (PEP-CTERM system associated)